MKTLVIGIILFFGLICSSAGAVSWQETINGWNSLPSWRAVYTVGNKKIIVDTILNKGQKTEEFRSGYLVKSKYTIWSGEETGTWEKYEGLEECFDKTTNSANWSLQFNPFAEAMDYTEISQGYIDWAWQQRTKTVKKWKYIKQKGSSKKKRRVLQTKNISYLSFSRKLNGMKANVTINGKPYASSVVVTLKKGKNTLGTSKTFVSPQAIDFQLPSNRCPQ